MEEIWKDVFGYEGLYMVSNLGRIKSMEISKKGDFGALKKRLEVTLSPFLSHGYLRIRLSKNGVVKNIFMHKIVAKAFIPNPNNYKYVNHLDFNRSNNNVSNLEWCTQSMNLKHAYDGGRMNPPSQKGKFGKLNKQSKPINQLTTDGVFIKRHESQGCASRELGISQGNIGMVVRGIRKSTGGFKFELA